MAKQKAVTQALSKLLADTYILYLKTQNYHWNVTGPNFSGLHHLFQTQYEDLALAADLIAERIRALDEKSPGSFSAFKEITEIREEIGFPAAGQILEKLTEDHEILAASAESVLLAAESVGDESTADLAIERQKSHQKHHWMLKAHLDEPHILSIVSAREESAV